MAKKDYYKYKPKCPTERSIQIGQLLHAYRGKKKIVDVAREMKEMGYNISREDITRFEKGDREPTLDKLIAFSEYYHVSIDSLVKYGVASQDNHSALTVDSISEYTGLKKDVIEWLHLNKDSKKILINVLNFMLNSGSPKIKREIEAIMANNGNEINEFYRDREEHLKHLDTEIPESEQHKYDDVMNYFGDLIEKNSDADEFADTSLINHIVEYLSFVIPENKKYVFVSPTKNQNCKVRFSAVYYDKENDDFAYSFEDTLKSHLFWEIEKDLKSARNAYQRQTADFGQGKKKNIPTEKQPAE